MKKISELLESAERRGVLAFGRMNPPTIGHAKLIDAALKEPGTKRIVVSHTQDNKKNPLHADEKLEILRKMYPNHKSMLRSSDKETPTIFHHAAAMHKEGVKHLTVMVGDDRAEEFRTKLNAYNGKFDKDGNGYHFKSITIKSAGARDPDSEGAEGMSASKMRDAAAKGDHKTFYSGLHPNLTHQDKSELLSKIKERASSKTEGFEIGDFVTNGIIEGVILNLHPKYASVICEGKEHRIWTNELTLSENQPKRDQLFKDSFIYKGYKTKNFNRSLAEEFKNMAARETDEYAILECLKCLDYILGVDDSAISENFKTVRVQIERLKRYSKKVGSTYITEAVVSTVEEELFKYAILEDLRFTTTDRNMVAKVIGTVANVSINNIDPTNIINQAVIQLRTLQLTPQGWAIVGRLLNVATKAGIRWNKDTFTASIKKEMGLI